MQKTSIIIKSILILCSVLIFSNQAQAACSIVVSATKTDGPDLNDAGAIAKMTGSTGVKKFTWYNASTGNLIGSGDTIKNLSAGSYKLIGIDSNSVNPSLWCKDSITFSLTDTFAAKLISNKNFTCFSYKFCPQDSIKFYISFIKKLGTSRIEFDFGDGNKLNVSTYSSGSKAYRVSNMYNTLGVKKLVIRFYNPNNVVEDSVSYSFTMVACSKVSGMFFYDRNRNCIKDPGEYEVYAKSIHGISTPELYIVDTTWLNSFESFYMLDSGKFSFYYPNNSSFVLELGGTGWWQTDTNTRKTTCGANLPYRIDLKNSNIYHEFAIIDTFEFIKGNNFVEPIDGDTAKQYGCSNDSFILIIQFIAPHGFLTQIVKWGDGVIDTIEYETDEPLYRYLKHYYGAPGNYTVRIERYRNQVLIDSPSFIAKIRNCGKVSGKVFVDNNKNCLYNSGDSLAHYATVQVKLASNGARFRTLFTDFNGNYTTNLDSTKNYLLQIVSPVMCSSIPNTVTLNAWNTPTITKDIPANPDSLNFICRANDQGINTPGSNYIIWMGYNSLGSVYGAKYTVTLPNKVTVAGSIGSTYTMNGNKVYLVSSGANTIVGLKLLIDTTAKLGDTLSFNVRLMKVGNEIDTADNVVQFCTPISGPYDPNDKRAASPTMDKDGSFYDNTDRLTYTIRFQNVGTAPAKNVHIKDMIDPNLDLNTIQVLDMSHKGLMYLNDNREMTISFSNINLPDSFHNEPQSHGSVTYSIKPISNLPLNTTIQNTAGIIFDYNAPVITNTTKNIYRKKSPQLPESIKIIQEGIEVKFNFNSETLIIETSEKMEKVKFYDLMGKEIISVYPNGNDCSIKNTSFKSQQVYVVQIETKSGIITRKIAF